MEDHTIIVKGSYEKAFLQIIIQTLKIYKDCIKGFAPIKPTCNQEDYVRDVEFLLKLIIKEEE